MKLEYKTFDEFKNNFRWGERWEIFDKGRDHLNITYECVDRHPEENTAIRIKNSDGSKENYTFQEISRMTSQFAHMLERHSINHGDRVAIILNPSLEYYVSLFGILKRGAVAVPCYSLLGPDAIEYRLEASNAKMAIANRERLGVVRPNLVSHLIISEDLQNLIQGEGDHYESNTSGDTLALVQFTSGTTGQPKPILYNHSAMSTTAVFIKFVLGLKDNDRCMCTSSPAWGHGIWYGTIGPLIFGNAIGAYSGKFDPEVLLEALEEFEITNLTAIPRVYKMLMQCGKIEKYKLKLRRLSYGGGTMEKEVTQYFMDKLGLYIAASYGTTENGPITLDFAFDDWKPRLGSSGKPMPGVKVTVLDDNGNELPPRQPGRIAFWRNEKWNLLGDFGYFDEEGYLWPQGRSDDVIKSSGYRIGPFEIEQVLEKHRAVQSAAVVGSPDEERGEIVKAFVIVDPEVNPTEELKYEIQDFVKRRLSMHEYPKEIEFVNEIPQTPDGKIKRKELKKREYERKGKQLI